MRNPREIFLANRTKARGGEVVYDGDRFPIAFRRVVQDRIDRDANEGWEIPRAEMIRWLVDFAYETLDHRAAVRRRRQQQGGVVDASQGGGASGT